LADADLFVSECELPFGAWPRPVQVVFQWVRTRALSDKRKIDREVAEVTRALERGVSPKRPRFVRGVPSGGPLELDLDAIARARSQIGMKGYITSLGGASPSGAIPPEAVVAAYRNHIVTEEFFRLRGADLDPEAGTDAPRPWDGDDMAAVEAHLTWAFARLAVIHEVERRTGVHIREFVDELKWRQSATFRTPDGPRTLSAALTPKAAAMIDSVRRP
jgi:hypothetical protein